MNKQKKSKNNQLITKNFLQDCYPPNVYNTYEYPTSTGMPDSWNHPATSSSLPQYTNFAHHPHHHHHHHNSPLPNTNSSPPHVIQSTPNHMNTLDAYGSYPYVSSSSTLSYSIENGKKKLKCFDIIKCQFRFKAVAFSSTRYHWQPCHPWTQQRQHRQMEVFITQTAEKSPHQPMDPH